jgi:predicted AlkP superfamily phosphohydrolase/phosphomutase
VPCPEFVTSAERRSQRFYLEPNNACVGGIRFNLLGREPDGCVTREDVTQLVASLREDLLSLVNVETGGPVVRAVEPIERWHAGCGLATDTMPDLFVEWERSTLINTVWSPKVGVVHGPYANWRTGDHRPDGLLLASGPGIAGGSTLPKIDVTDLAPTILARLGIPDPGHYDGRTRAWLAPPG